MREKPQRRNVFFIIQGDPIELERFMKVQPSWIGWNKSRRGGLRSLQLRQLVFGITIELTLLIRPGTLTLQLRLSEVCVFLMVQSLYLMVLQVLSHNQKQCGAKLISIAFHVFVL